MAKTFRVGITRDILDARGEPAFGRAALAILDGAEAIDWDYLPAVVPEITADHAAQYDALYVNIPRVPAAAVARADCRLRVVARHGVGYDSVDVAAMTRAGIVVTHTPSSMPRPVATIALTFVLALAGKLFLKDRLTRDGPLARADGSHGDGPHRTDAGCGRRRPHRQGAAADGARVRPEASRR